MGAAAVAAAEAERLRAIEEEEANSGPGLDIYFGSQTGTAEGFAKEIAEQCGAIGFRTKCIDLEDFEEETFATDCQGSISVFLMATYGEGDPTDNAIEFHSWIKDKDNETDLSGAKFAVFGLGNTQYEHYNAMGKLVNKRLEALGATRTYEYGEGDDDNDIDEDFETWREGLVSALSGEAFPQSEGRPRSASVPSIAFEVIDVAPPEDPRMLREEGKFDVRYCDVPEGKIDLSSRPYFQCCDANVVAHRELRQSAGKDGLGSTVHCEIDIGDLPVEYGTADNLGVLAENDANQVASVATFLGAKLDSWFSLESCDPAVSLSPLFPTPCTVRTALACYCDLNAVPSRNVLGKLSFYATLKEHADRLAWLASMDGKEDYKKHILQPRWNYAQLFREYSSIRIPLAAFFQIVPRLQARYYTIASSAKLNPNRIHLTVSVVTEPKQGSSEPFRGVCSAHIGNQTLPSHSKGKRPKGKRGRAGKWPSLRVFVRESTFKMPPKAATPIIMVGPGTGIAPMMALIQERYYQRDTMGEDIGDSILFFGCRTRNEDFIYSEELQQACDDGILTALHVAFSREQAQKVYVQHKLLECGEAVWNLLRSRMAYFYVCGGIQMGNDVLATVQQIAVKYGGMTEADAKTYTKRMQSKGRYIQELWS